MIHPRTAEATLSTRFDSALYGSLGSREFATQSTVKIARFKTGHAGTRLLSAGNRSRSTPPETDILVRWESLK